MKALAGEFKRALLAGILLSLLLCGIYPLAIWSIGQLLYPEKANGSLLKREHDIVGSILIGQQFTSPAYFHSRPSAVAYASSGSISGGSNLGPLSKLLHEQTALRIASYREENGLTATFPLAADAVYASACGLDPHITPANAAAQTARVARSRGLSRNQVERLVRHLTEGRQLGILGEARINVLRLNLALDSR